VTDPQPAVANPYRRTLLRQERSVNTRRAIMRAAADVWAEKGYHEATVEDLCNAAGIGRSTYYLHFESKERLLVEFALATAEGVNSDVDDAVRHGSFDDEIEAFVEGLASRMEHTPRSLAVTIMRQVALNSVAARDLGRDQILFDDVLSRIVRDGQQQGRIRLDIVPADVEKSWLGWLSTLCSAGRQATAIALFAKAWICASRWYYKALRRGTTALPDRERLRRLEIPNP
jgi:AcrR family transcriptional regulator